MCFELSPPGAVVIIAAVQEADGSDVGARFPRLPVAGPLPEQISEKVSGSELRRGAMVRIARFPPGFLFADELRFDPGPGLAADHP